MKKYLLVLVGLCCVLSYALAERPDYPELKKSDANIICLLYTSDAADEL